ncbi:glucan biosynthesis protein [Pseudooceanicola sp. LIPI14-2-Ac024]|uniref:glucan biosynthesis protein n=1 Tax=Pseudooceanicola sp. LIPI14-2-Ac024 TaxID=3344875 RepID=UPI0035D0BE71
MPTLLGSSALAQTVAATAPSEAPESKPFSFEILTEWMQMAARGDATPPEQVSGFLTELDYDDYQRIRFDPERVRWTEDGSSVHLNAFHLGWLFKEPVHIHEVVDGQATEMPFSTADFIYDDVEAEIPEDFGLPGVAGFRLMTPINRADKFDEMAAFLGASYFRALGRDTLYGLSARGLAVNTGLPEGEEFPRFNAFWIERPVPGAETVTLYAALRSPSVTGAYKFVLTPGATTTVDVTARLFFREDIGQLGIAPLTSMYLHGGVDQGGFDDFRPSVHDSEALVMNLASGETFVRPLNNPPHLAGSYFTAENPTSFGLVQRNRDFDNYLDAQAHYERRPSLMIEPLGDWGKGMVRLMEIPSDLEGNDNIVAYWIPETPARAGGSMEISYRQHWGLTPPGDGSDDRARILRTRAGKGGVAGVKKETDRRKFVIDFDGALLAELPDAAEVSPSVSVANGEVAEAVLSRIPGTGTWRLVIEAAGEPGATVELKAALTGYGKVLTETWVYQWVKE